MNTTSRRLLICVSLLAPIACGGSSGGASDCGTFEASCDVPSDNGVHTCYDVVVADAAAVQQAKTTCASQATSGSVLAGCCNHDVAVARCIFSPTQGGTSTEWFLSGTVASAQSACASKNGAFTAF
jgi:hypothetical protein